MYECSLRYAADEGRSLNEESTDIAAAALDATWHKRGNTSINSVMTVTSLDRGKVLDFECLSKFCNMCIRKPLSSDEQLLKEHKE